MKWNKCQCWTFSQTHNYRISYLKLYWIYAVRCCSHASSRLSTRAYKSSQAMGLRFLSHFSFLFPSKLIIWCHSTIPCDTNEIKEKCKWQTQPSKLKLNVAPEKIKPLPLSVNAEDNRHKLHAASRRIELISTIAIGQFNSKWENVNEQFWFLSPERMNDARTIYPLQLEFEIGIVKCLYFSLAIWLGRAFAVVSMTEN